MFNIEKLGVLRYKLIKHRDKVKELFPSWHIGDAIVTVSVFEDSSVLFNLGGKVFDNLDSAERWLDDLENSINPNDKKQVHITRHLELIKKNGLKD